MNIFTEKFKDVVFAITPIFLLVLILNFTFLPLGNLFYDFLIGCLFFVLGLTFFLVGVEIGVAPFGNLTGPMIARRNKFWFLVVITLILGFIVSIAEPSLLVLAKEIELFFGISNLIVVFIISLGIAVSMVLGLTRIIYNFPIHLVLLVLYGIIFLLAIFSSSDAISIAFDASGATTGVLAVPFILALGRGITLMKKDSKASEKDSFGLVAIASAGAIISFLIFDFFFKLTPVSEVKAVTSNLSPFLNSLIDSSLSLIPLFLVFLLFNLIFLKLKRNHFKRIFIGFIYAYIGLVMFMYGVNSGFMETGFFIGKGISSFNEYFLISFGFIIGFITILAEPAIYVLTDQIEEVTSGYISKNAVLFSIAIGVGLSVMFSVIRILNPSIELWYFLLPGYLIAIVLNNFAPKLFVGIAFDAGGVATGPMTATFILSFMAGIATNSSFLINSFGMISLVALTPIITLQILGIIFKIKSERMLKYEL